MYLIEELNKLDTTILRNITIEKEVETALTSQIYNTNVEENQRIKDTKLN